MNTDASIPVWQRLRGLLRSSAEPTAESRLAAIRLAAAILMVEMAQADAEHHPQEREVLRRQLEERFSLDPESAQALLAAAEQSATQSVSLHRYIDDINTGLDYRQRQSVLQMLWQVAYADGQLHRYEEHLMRRMANLLGLQHEDFIRTKLQVLGQV